MEMGIFEGFSNFRTNHLATLPQSETKRVVGSESFDGKLQGVLVIPVFGLRVFGYACFRKLINIKEKNVRFTTHSRITQFLALLKHEFIDFCACSSEIVYLHDSQFTRRVQECNPEYKREPPVFKNAS